MKIDFSKIDTFEWDILYYIERENEVGVEAFKKLCENQEASLKTTQAEFKHLVDVELGKLHPDEHSSYYMQLFEQDEMVLKEILRQQRYSICQSIFAFLEARLGSICNLIEHKFNFKLKISDLYGGEDLGRYMNYLNKVYEIDAGSIEQYFTGIRNQKIVRNLIAHQNGIAKPNQIKKINLVNGLSLLEIGDSRQVVISDPIYLFDLLDKMKLFYKRLLTAVDDRAKVINGNV